MYYHVNSYYDSGKKNEKDEPIFYKCVGIETCEQAGSKAGESKACKYCHGLIVLEISPGATMTTCGFESYGSPRFREVKLCPGG